MQKLKIMVMATLMAFGLSTMDTMAQVEKDGPEKPRRTHTDQMKGKRSQRQAKFRANRNLQLPGLTAEQKESMQKIRLDTRKKGLPLTNELNEKRARLRTLTSAEKADVKAINRTAEEIGSIRTQLLKQKLAAQQEIRSILTEEQRVYWDSRPRRQNRMGRDRGM